ncbi:EAL domain-containing protein [Thalassobacillus hwangdonensis]|uniref:EAL domain-containing protein n=1 Tax=Thalassobacillus hwangdonensis TaxID=546108 RepID=A0ABW3L2Z5_9BACI
MNEIIGQYNYGFVVLSIIVAVIASYTCLKIVERLARAKDFRWLMWLFAGGITLGGGIWSMHFVAMLAYDMGMVVTYNADLLTLSILSAALASFLAFYLISKGLNLEIFRVTGAFLIATGIVSMHYVGMEAMEMGAEIVYDRWLVGASVVIALVASYVALRIFSAFSDQSGRRISISLKARWFAAGVMGAAIAGMHYTGMASASFYPSGQGAMNMDAYVEPMTLAYAIVLISLVVTGIIVMLVHYDSTIEAQTDELEWIDTMYRTIIETANDAIVTSDHKGRILSWNKAAERIFGYTADEVKGKSLEIIMPPEYREAHMNGMARFNETRQARVIGRTVELDGLRKSGEVFPLELSLSAIEDGEDLYFTGLMRDISDRVKDQGRIEELVYKDELTKLPNRKMLHDHLVAALAHASELQKRVAVLFTDLDRFKQVNDVYGHRIGDEVLKLVTERIAGCIGEKDMVARQSSDEFILVMTQTSFYEAGHMAERIIEALREPMVFDETELFMTPSIGISLYPEDGAVADDLIQHADTAMSQAKFNGGNQYQFFTNDLNDTIAKKMMLETGLRRAVEHEELEVFYQPKVEIERNEVTSFEALIRWNYPELGLVSPADFIPLAEETGLIIPIGEWMMEASCRQFQEWLDAGAELDRISVNISAVQFRQRDFPEVVERVLAKTGLAPRHLEIELTESLVQNTALAIPVMHRLKQMGVKLSLDDFGTGYSSLSYLKEFPLDTLKIDRSFIQTIHQSSKDQAVVDMIIHMALKLDLNVIAEGVETEEQLEYLASTPCQHYQGYLCSPPVPRQQIAERFLGKQWKLSVEEN